MTTENERVIAAAKKAARRMARSSESSYQTCLDSVARSAGREHWSAFRADPVAHPSFMPAEGQDDPSRQPPAPATEAPVDAPAKAAAPIPSPRQPARRPGRAATIGRSILAGLGIARVSEELRAAERRHILTRDEYDGCYSLGRVVGGPAIFMRETLPMLVLAPPGTGKTAGAVMPTIMTADRSTLVVHDETDVWMMTSGWRATLGPVHVLNLGGPSRSSLNPLHPDWVPSDDARRRSYVAHLADVIHPDDPKASAYMAQAIDETIATSEAPSFGEAARLLARRLGSAGDAEANNAILWLTPLLTSAVRRCTTDAGVKPQDLRGIPDGVRADGLPRWRPTTVYIVRAPQGAGGGMVASLLQTAIWHHALGARPGEPYEDGGRAGPLGIIMMLEGSRRLSTMPLLATALEAGRSTKVGHVVVADSIRGLRRLFDERNREDHLALFSVTLALCQNDQDTARSLTERFGLDSMADVLSMPLGRHLLGVHGVARPLEIATPYFFQNQKTLVRTYNPRTGKGPPPVVVR